MIQEEEHQEHIITEEPDAATKDAMLQISKWTRQIAVIGFALGAFIVMVMLFSGAQILQTLATSLPVNISNIYPVLVAAFFILFFLAAMVLYFLNKASHLFAQGVQQNNKELLSEAFEYVKKFFIVVIIFASLQLVGNLSNFF